MLEPTDLQSRFSSASIIEEHYSWDQHCCWIPLSRHYEQGYEDGKAFMAIFDTTLIAIVLAVNNASGLFTLNLPSSPKVRRSLKRKYVHLQVGRVMLLRYFLAHLRVVVVFGDVLPLPSLLVIYRKTFFSSVRRRVDFCRISGIQRLERPVLAVQRYSELAGILRR